MQELPHRSRAVYLNNKDPEKKRRTTYKSMRKTLKIVVSLSCCSFLCVDPVNCFVFRYALTGGVVTAGGCSVQTSILMCIMLFCCLVIPPPSAQPRKRKILFGFPDLFRMFRMFPQNLSPKKGKKDAQTEVGHNSAP